MEAAVERLETLFKRSEADLDYMEKSLKLAVVGGAPETQENPVILLEELKMVKARHAALNAQLTQVAAAQEESMEAIKKDLSRISELVTSAHNIAAIEGDHPIGLQQQIQQLLAWGVS